jgi:hypothetical protein
MDGRRGEGVRDEARVTRSRYETSASSFLCPPESKAVVAWFDYLSSTIRPLISATNARSVRLVAFVVKTQGLLSMSG